ncbi:hypothetical protein EW145_g3810 [Phellinidium pouzarii]|uniref:Uncharacterized protein n=1 Tax=Phellinidium pouzarii TaxID=167371 RepID=A0A4S4L5R1_9AGAM|nr:hypothetical protein EW145_g3810 [Phellinidium pouzarii]
MAELICLFSYGNNATIELKTLMLNHKHGELSKKCVHVDAPCPINVWIFLHIQLEEGECLRRIGSSTASMLVVAKRTSEIVTQRTVGVEWALDREGSAALARTVAYNRDLVQLGGIPHLQVMGFYRSREANDHFTLSIFELPGSSSFTIGTTF